MTIRYGSVCSGIEAATVAWHPLGWEPAWFSEIEAFPKAVLAHRYPGVKDLGDMNLIEDGIRDGSIESPDILVGGTPCTSFSLAGARKSLSDERGVGILALTYVRIANAIDDVQSVRGRPGVITVWENVPGVLNTKDNAFGCLLGALAGEDVPLEPPGGRWKDAGFVLGPKRAAAWRCLDAQYFGLAQRRKRVFLVSGPREWFRPEQILFEFEGVRRDIAPSRAKGKSAPSPTTRGLETVGTETYDMRGNGDGNLVNSLVGDHACRPTDYTPVVVEPRHVTPEISRMLCSQDKAKSDGLGTDLDLSGGVDEKNVTCFERHDQDARYKEIIVSPTIGSQSDNVCDLPLVMHLEPCRDTAATLTSKTAGVSQGWAPHNETENLVPVRRVLPFDTTQVTSALNYSNPKEGDPCHPLASTAHPPAVAIQDVLEIEKHQNGSGGNDEGVSNTVDAATEQGISYGCDLSQKAEGVGFKEEISACVAPGTHPGHGNHVITAAAMAFKASHYTRDKDGSPSETCPPLTKEADKGDQDPLLIAPTKESYCVRRLTPIECFKPDMIVLGSNKPIASVSRGDTALSKGSTSVVTTMSRKYSGPMRLLKACGTLPIEATPEHPFLVVEGRKAVRNRNKVTLLSDPVWKKASDIRLWKGGKGDFLLIPVITGRSHPEFYSLDPYVVNSCRNHKKMRKTVGLPDIVRVNCSTAWLIGLFVAEGSVQKTKDGMVVTWSLGKHEVHLVEKTVSLIEGSLGFKVRVDEKKTAFNVTVSSAPLGRFLERHCGKGARNKQIPDFILTNHNTDILEAALSGYLDGDGYRQKLYGGKNVRIGCTTSSKTLALQLQLIHARLGRFSKVYEGWREGGIIEGRRIGRFKMFSVQANENVAKKCCRHKFLEDYIAVPVTRNTETQYEGTVHNIETEDNAYLASNLVVHNCERLQGFPDGYTRIPWKGKLAEDCPDGPRYAALGNSMAVTVMAWIGRRMDAYLKSAPKEV